MCIRDRWGVKPPTPQPRDKSNTGFRTEPLWCIVAELFFVYNLYIPVATKDRPLSCELFSYILSHVHITLIANSHRPTRIDSTVKLSRVGRCELTITKLNWTQFFRPVTSPVQFSYGDANAVLEIRRNFTRNNKNNERLLFCASPCSLCIFPCFHFETPSPAMTLHCRRQIAGG